MTTQEACQRLDKSEKTVRRWLKSGKLEGVKVDGIWDISEESVDALLSDRTLGRTEEENVRSDEVGIARLEESNKHLKEENQYLKERIQELESASERADTVMLQLTRQLEQSQRLLEHDQAPWWQRWFRKRTDFEGG
ncbi:hypothetical protein ES702_03195 [subsurface metagenome]